MCKKIKLSIRRWCNSLGIGLWQYPYKIQVVQKLKHKICACVVFSLIELYVSKLTCCFLANLCLAMRFIFYLTGLLFKQNCQMNCYHSRRDPKYPFNFIKMHRFVWIRSWWHPKPCFIKNKAYGQ